MTFQLNVLLAHLVLGVGNLVLVSVLLLLQSWILRIEEFFLKELDEQSKTLTIALHSSGGIVSQKTAWAWLVSGVLFLVRRFLVDLEACCIPPRLRLLAMAAPVKMVPESFTRLVFVAPDSLVRLAAVLVAPEVVNGWDAIARGEIPPS